MKARWGLAALIAVLAFDVFAVEERVRVAFVGDVMLADTEKTGKLVSMGKDPFAYVRKILSANDLRVANFESSAGTRGKPDPNKPYSFRTSKLGVKSFASLFDVAGVANNHAGDYGRSDFVETLNALEKAGASTFGGGKDLVQAHKARIFERKGIKIALLGYLDFFPRWFSAAPGMAGVAWLDGNQTALDITKAREEGADIVIVVPHWGTEHEPKANDHQRRMARVLIDAGADAVIGGHPHVVQDYEIYKGRPIIYSLGNFVFDGFKDEDNLTGWILFADFDKQGVSSLRTHVVKIDANGFPHPVPSQRGICWQKGKSIFVSCAQGDMD